MYLIYPVILLSDRLLSADIVVAKVMNGIDSTMLCTIPLLSRDLLAIRFSNPSHLVEFDRIICAIFDTFESESAAKSLDYPLYHLVVGQDITS